MAVLALAKLYDIDLEKQFMQAMDKLNGRVDKGLKDKIIIKSFILNNSLQQSISSYIELLL